MNTQELETLLKKGDKDCLVLLECSNSNIASKVVQISFRDCSGTHKYLYICDDAENIIYAYMDDADEKRIIDLEIKEIQ